MKRAILALASFFLLSCTSENDGITGYWVNEDPSCTTSCGFTIIKKDTASSDLFASFDKGPFYLGKNGPVINNGRGQFIIHGSLGDFPLKEKDGYLYGKNGEKYTRSKDLVGEWSSISKSCDLLCNFNVTRSHDDRLLHVKFNDKNLYGFYDGVLYRKDNNTLIIKGSGGDTQLSIEENGNLKKISGISYKRIK